MKVAFSTSGQDLDGPLDQRFGRAARFLVCEMESPSGSFQLIDNEQNLQASQGAGVQAAQTIVSSGATRLVTGNCGPKAFRVLKAAGIEVYNSEASTINEALDLLTSGKLTPAQSANVEGHWS